MIACMTELSRYMTEFRGRFQLSKAKAAKVLGVSANYVRSIEDGLDVSTGLPFRPRESTLRQLAAKMTEFGYPVSYEQLMVAAGYLTQAELDFHEQKGATPGAEEIARGEFKIPGLDALAASSDTSFNDLDQADKELVYEAMKAAGKAVIDSILAGKRQRKLR